MKTLLVLPLLILSINCVSQNYTPFYFEDSPQWTEGKLLISFGSNVWFTGDYFCEGDTLIGEQTYTLYYLASGSSYDWPWEMGNQLIGGFRENDEKQIVFIPFDLEYASGICDLQVDTEVLLYDFNLEVGDELIVDPVFHSLELPDVYLNSIEYVQVGGAERKVLNFHKTNGFSHAWVEGIGSSNGLIHPLGTEEDLFCLDDDLENPRMTVSVCYSSLFSSYQNIYLGLSDISAEGIELDCEPIITDVLESEEKPSIIVYPNPASDVLNVYFDDLQRLNGSQLFLFNAVGQEIKRLSASLFDTTYLLPVGDLENGIYYLSLISNGIVRQNDKILISK